MGSVSDLVLDIFIDKQTKVSDVNVSSGLDLVEHSYLLTRVRFREIFSTVHC